MTSTAEMSSANFIPILSSSPPPLGDSFQDADQSFADFGVADDSCEKVDDFHNQTLTINFKHDNDHKSSPKNDEPPPEKSSSKTNGLVLPANDNNIPSEELVNAQNNETANEVVSDSIRTQHSDCDINSSVNINQNNLGASENSIEENNFENKNQELNSSIFQESNDSHILAENSEINHFYNGTLKGSETNLNGNDLESSHQGRVNKGELWAESDTEQAPSTFKVCESDDFENGDLECSRMKSHMSSENEKEVENDFNDFTANFDSQIQKSENFSQSGSINDDFGDFENSFDQEIKIDSTSEKHISDDEFGDFTTNFENQIIEDTGEDADENFCDFSTNFEDKIIEGTGEGTDDNFGDFTTNFEGEMAKDGVDDDFGDFTTNFECQTGANNGEGDDDDFGDFTNNFDSQELNCSNRDGDFAEFGEFENTTSIAESDNWAADFQSSASVTVSEDISLKKDITGDVWETVRAAIVYPAPISQVDDVDPPSQSIGDDVSIEDDSLSNSELFKKLKVIEDSKSLNLQWTCLKSNDFLLMALDIDSRNILFGQNRNPAMPIFAANLGLLEPMKSTENSSKKSELLEGGNSQNVCSKTSAPPSPSQVDYIPPVQFDWSVSGLTNPLEELSSSTSILLDVDIFSAATTNVPSSTSKSSSLEDEFLSSPSPEQCTSTSSSILDRLMSSAKQTTYIHPQGTAKKRPPGLSGEAIEILDKLVSLSFMNAKVLMFPISADSNDP